MHHQAERARRPFGLRFEKACSRKEVQNYSVGRNCIGKHTKTKLEPPLCQLGKRPTSAGIKYVRQEAVNASPQTELSAARVREVAARITRGETIRYATRNACSSPTRTTGLALWVTPYRVIHAGSSMRTPADIAAVASCGERDQAVSGSERSLDTLIERDKTDTSATRRGLPRLGSAGFTCRSRPRRRCPGVVTAPGARSRGPGGTERPGSAKGISFETKSQ